MPSIYKAICALALAVLGSSAAIATPTLAVNPASITTDEVGTVQIDVGNVAGTTVVLRLYADANGNGVIDAPADGVVWTDVVIDNAPDWSPNMFSDTDAAVGAVTVDVRLFGPLEFPYSAGNFVWQAVDSADLSTQTVAFSITHTAQTQSVAGTARDSITTLGVPGALVVLLPYCEEGDEALRFYSAFADNSGAFVIQVPAEVECRNRIVLAVKPGFVTSFFDQPNLVFDGASQFTNQDPELTPGTWDVDGQLQYATGPQAGGGIPGVLIFASSDGGLLSVAFTDENGDYRFVLDDGDWDIETPEDGIDTRGAVFLEDFTTVNVAGGPVAVPTLTLPHANAFFEGTLRDDVAALVAGRPISAYRSDACDPNCYRSFTYSRADGTFSMGVVAPTSPATYDYNLSVEDPLTGLVGEQRGCETISAGDTLTGRNLDHFAPTNFITGTMLDIDGQPLAGMCLNAQAFPSCTGYTSAAVTGCDGSYAIPVLDGDWSVHVEIEDFASLYGNLAAGETHRSVSVAGADATDVDFILGPSRDNPHITQLVPEQVVAGSQLIIVGYGFSFGSDPQVFFDAVPATLLSFRADRGGLIVEVPVALTAGAHTITVVNTDSGVTSDPACVDLGAGPYTSVCTLSGTVTDSGGAVADALVFAEFDGDFVRGALTDMNGDYSIGLDAFGIYDLDFHRPAGTAYIDADYVVACGVTQDHLFTTGWQLTGQIVDDTFDAEPVGELLIVANEIGGSGYSTFTLTDGDGFFTLIVPSGDFILVLVSPEDTHFLTGLGSGITTITADTAFGQITATTGSLFSGTVVDDAGNGVSARVSAFRKSDGVLVTRAFTDTCSGRFNVALPFNVAMPPDEYRIDLEDVAAAGLQSSVVQWVVGSDADQLADFDFVMFDEAVVPAAAAAPRIVFIDPGPVAQEDQPMRLFSGNLAGTTVDVLFSDGVGGFLNGTSTIVDAERASLVTRVPSGAASGEMKIRVDGVDSRPVPFTLLPGIFSAGGLTVSGTVSGAGGAGTTVAVIWQDPAAGCDDDDGLIMDYGMTDGSGNYGPLSHPGGEIEVFFLPPSGTMLTTASEPRSGVVANLTVDVTLVNGVAVTVRAIDAAMNPLEDIVFFSEYEGAGGEDVRITDVNGDATLYVAPGDLFFGLIPFRGERLIEVEIDQTITGPFDFGDQVLAQGVMVGSAALRQSDRSPVTDVLVEGQGDMGFFEFFFETHSGVDGGFHGPIPADTFFQIQGHVFDDMLANFTISGQSDPVSDSILYPAVEVGPAGFVSGLVRDAGTLAPLVEISVIAFEEDPLNPGSPGSFNGFTRTCSDGTYRVKLPVGDHFVLFDDFEFGLYAGEWYDDAVCFENGSTVTVTAGNTTIADADLVRAGTISGVVLDNGMPLADAGVCAFSVALGNCTVACSPNTDGSGLYNLTLPPATDYQVQAFSMFGTQCYDLDDTCTASTPVTVVAEMDTPNIDFNFNCSFADLDGDGVSGCAGDCDDGDANNFPGNVEVCDFQDNDCDTLVDDADPGVVGQTTWYADVDGDGDGDPAVSVLACTMPVGFVANNGDCAPGDPNVYSGAPEVNDGADNQCPGEPGFGSVDEIGGVAGFFNPADDNEFSWPAQSGATLYKVARSGRGDFSDTSTLFTTAGTLWSDPTLPAVGESLNYLVRSLSPFVGSWGQTTAGDERMVNVLVNGNMEDWTTPTNLATWIEINASGPVEQETDPAQVVEGDFAARLTRTGSGVLGILGLNLSLTPGQDYVLSFAAKFDRVESNAVQVRVFNFTTGEDLQSNGSWAAGANSFNFALTTSYQVFSIPFTVDPGFAPTDDLRVILRHRFTTAVGTVLWIDDVRIEE